MNQPEVVFDSADVEKNKVLAVLAYIWILFLIPLFAAKDSAYARFHALQGAALFVVGVGVSIVEWILPYSLSILGRLLWLGVLALAIIGSINAIQGRGRALPVIGGLFQSKF